MLQVDVVEASTSPSACPLVLVTKKDGSVRFCVDLCAINAVMKKDAYPLPRIDKMLDTIVWSTVVLLLGSANRVSGRSKSVQGYGVWSDKCTSYL